MSQTYSVLQVTPLPVLKSEYVDDFEKENKPRQCYDTIGGILFDTKYAWTANGPRFTLFNSKTGAKVSAWTFGSVVKDCSTKVVCVDELRRPTGKLPLLVIGLECDLTGGMICIFDITGSRVLRSIQINNKVTSLHVVDASYDICPLPGPLRAFDGILSIGTADGNVLLLDICRQTCEEALNGVGLSDIRDEINCCQIKTLFLGDIYSLELHKQVAIKNGEHLCIHLNATNNAIQHFVLKGPKGEDRVYVNKVEVTVSALHYCPQLGSLLVGYNFGAWQLWNLINLQLVYTSPIYEENVPVSHFTIQEPCDDPRAFCYVWVIYSNIEPYETGFPVAVLYSLNYETKEWHEGYGILYQDLTSCAVRFQTDLMVFDEEGSSNKNVQKGARCVRVQAINKSITKGSLHEGHEEILTLCSIVWSGWNSDSNTGQHTYMSLFDLNQWYKEQMPNSPRSEEYETFMSRVCLSELLHAVNSERVPFLDVRMDVNTLSQFIGSQRLEEHYYPSSLAFQLCTLRECDVSIFNNQGSQRALLSHLECGGPLSLIKPMELFHSSINLGLSPLFIDIPIKTSLSIDYKREILLNIALEQQLLGWLCRCASAWSNGSHSAAGCTLHFLLTWGWQRAQVLKQNADKLSIPLFDFSGLRLDANTHNLLSNCARQLKNLSTLFNFVIQRFARFVVNPDVIKQQRELLEMVSMHLEVLQWLLNIGLLPECPLSSYPRADEFNRISAPYPVDNLVEYYNQRRTSLRTFNTEQFSISGSLLFIDNLISIECGGHKLQKQWENDGGDGFYPPPSLQALMRTYLIENVDISFKHCVIVYVFLDLAMTLDQSRYKTTITHLIKFPAVFQLSPSIIKITQAFWQLDHGDFATAMEQLLDPLVATEDLKMWHHRVALKALLAQDQHNYALLYLQVRQPAVTDVQDLCTVLSLYVANNMLDEAFHFQRHSKSADNETKLLRHFYKECDRKNEIPQMLYFPLTQTEEEAFMKYLEEVKHPHLKDLRVFYYIQNSRYMDAYDVNNKYSKIKMESKGLHGQQNVEFRDFIMTNITDTLPDISKSLMLLCCKEKNKLWKEVEKPEPFSVFVHNTKEQVKYKSTVIQAGLLKAKEIWTHPVLDSSTTKDKANASVSMLSEEMPFVNTPKTMRLQPKRATPVIYPKIIKLEQIGQGDDGPSPAKRFKLTPRAPVTSPEVQKSIRVEPINMEVTCTNLSVKLDTPVIKRKTLKRSTSLRLSNEKFSVGTPQSILKIRSLVRNSESPDSAIDSSIPDNVPSGNKNLMSSIHNSYVDAINVVSSPRRTGLGLTPRKPIPRTPRPAVRFDISRTPSESSLTSNSSEPTYEVIQEKALVHSPLEYIQKESPTSANINTSQQLKANSGSNSLSTEEVFYTPDVSSNSNIESKETSGVEINIETDESKVLNQQVLKESVNVIITRGRKSLIDSEVRSPRSSKSPKRSFEDSSSTRISQESIEVLKADDSVEGKDLQSIPTSPKTPRARRSYKGILPESGIRSSPRFRKSIQTEAEQLQSVDKNLDLLTTESVQKQSEDFKHTEPTEISTSESTESNTESPIKSRLRGRRPLSRQVLEFNTFSKLTDSPVIQQSPLSVSIDSNTSQLEVSSSKSVTTYECKSTGTVTNESLKTTVEEYKDVFTKNKDANTSEQSFKHTHEVSSSVSKKDRLEEVYDAESTSTLDANSSIDVSDDLVNVAYVADSILETSKSTLGIEEDKDTVSSTEQISHEPHDLEILNTRNIIEDQDAVSSTEQTNIVQSHDFGENTNILEVSNESSTVENKDSFSSTDPEPLEKNQELQVSKEGIPIADEPETTVVTTEDVKILTEDNTENTGLENEAEMNVYDDLSNDNYGSADPEMNVFEISDDLDLNQGMCGENNPDILEMDTNYSDVEVFADKSDVLSNVIAVNDSSLGQLEETDNEVLNKAIQEPSSIDFDTTEAKYIIETDNKIENDASPSNVEIIELDSSSDDAEEERYSEDSAEQTTKEEQSSNDSYEEYEEHEVQLHSEQSHSKQSHREQSHSEQSHSEQSDVSSEVHSTNEDELIYEQHKEILSESESSQNVDSTSDDYGSESQQSKTSEAEEAQSSEDEGIENPEPTDIVTTSGQLDIAKENPQIEPSQTVADQPTEVSKDTLEVASEEIPENAKTVNFSQTDVTAENDQTGDTEEEFGEVTVDYSQLDTIPEEPSEMEADSTEADVSKEASQSAITLEKDSNLIRAEGVPVTVPEATETEGRSTNVSDKILEMTKVVDRLNIIPEKASEVTTTSTHADENIKAESNAETSAALSENSGSVEQVTIRQAQKSSKKDVLHKSDILDKTPSVETSMNTTCLDILDDSVDFRPTSTPRPSVGMDILDKSEFYSSRGSLHPLSQTDVLDRSVESLDQDKKNSNTPARRSRRLSSLQAASTPDQLALRRTTRRSASFSFSQNTGTISEPSFPKKGVSTSAGSEQPASTSRNQSNNSTTKIKASVTTLLTKGKRSTSADVKQLSIRKRKTRSASADEEEKRSEVTPSSRKRRATSVTAELSVVNKNEQTGKNVETSKKASARKTEKHDSRSTTSEGGRKQKHPLTSKKSRSIIIASATRTKLEEYATARRLTRRQANLLEKTLGTTHIDVPHLQDTIESDSDESENHERGPNIDQMDPINLLDKPEFEGKHDSDEEKAINKSPASTIPESPIGSRLRSRSSMSNNSPKSETSTVYSLSEAGPSKRQKSAKRVIIEPDDANIASRTRQRSQSTDETFSSVQLGSKSSPPKLRRTRRSSKDSETSGVSQTRSLIEGKKIPVTRRRALSAVDEPSTVKSPSRRSERHSRTVKSELPKIIEEQAEAQSSRATRSSKKN